LKKGVSDVIDVAAGAGHTVALKKDGTVWAWGDNDYGELGDGTQTLREAPVQVKGEDGVGYLTGVIAVEAGETHVMALKGDGTVWAWGKNLSGQLGNGTAGEFENKSTPVQVKGEGGAGFLTGVTQPGAWSRTTSKTRLDGLSTGSWRTPSKRTWSIGLRLATNSGIFSDTSGESSRRGPILLGAPSCVVRSPPRAWPSEAR
jgi:hypothetical protein